MKMKIFKGTDLQSLESKINEWLEAKGVNLIHHITHANNLGTTIITVWWGELDIVHDSLADVKARHTYEVPRAKISPGVDLISDVLPFGRL